MVKNVDEARVQQVSDLFFLFIILFMDKFPSYQISKVEDFSFVRVSEDK